MEDNNHDLECGKTLQNEFLMINFFLACIKITNTNQFQELCVLILSIYIHINEVNESSSDIRNWHLVERKCLDRPGFKSSLGFLLCGLG